MKKCSYCGAEYPDDAVMCAIDQTPFECPAEPPPPEPKLAEYHFWPLSAEGRQQDFVTLVSCATLPAADVIISRLKVAGIEAFIPDESLMQIMGGNLNALVITHIFFGLPSDLFLHTSTSGAASRARSFASPAFRHACELESLRVVPWQ